MPWFKQKSSNTGSKSFQTSLTFREFQAQHQTKAIRLVTKFWNLNRNTVKFANVYEGFGSNMHLSFLVPDRAGAWLFLLQVSVKFTRFAHFCKMLPAFAGFLQIFNYFDSFYIYPQEHFYLFSDDSRFFLCDMISPTLYWTNCRWFSTTDFFSATKTGDICSFFCFAAHMYIHMCGVPSNHR